MKQIIFRENMWNTLINYLFQKSNIETGAYALYKTSIIESSVKILVKDVIIPKDNDYCQRSSAFVSFKPEFTEKAFQKCESLNCHLLDIHTHPWSTQVQFSSIDDREAVRIKIPYMKKYVKNTFIAFMVLGKGKEIAKARFWNHQSNNLISINRIVII